MAESSSIEPPEFPLKSNYNVLAIDTDLKVLEFIEKSCNKYSHQVKICSETSSAIKLLLEEGVEFDLIIMELHMPMIDGYEFLEMLDDEAIDVPFIMMSEDRTPLSQKKAFKHGACDYWIKPFFKNESLFENKKLWSPMYRHHFYFRRNILEEDEESDEKGETGNNSDGEAEADDDTLHKKE
ncbi:hypothetical protein LR48_Vigan325s002100 [Vigna angularis]|uniref:Two-component response regulator n=2 Tax=Phaseolus angularis TaxID=3914 RepID=A0A0L9T9S7_PHAAN|nr:two-component response regulator ARR14-like [Vigna angularis]KAG2411087.1 Two-component response regulator [Vigna angularis]KOM26849.1 hypothetical protein LR48_Vigan325s002100 [Vigna angularis]BAT72731.1 hypothetical protein VIGAN_01016400 [Vigna angularis var. angularis]